MRAISLWQPWASLIFAHLKRYETRHWPTLYRGPLAIHAAQKLVTDVERDLGALLTDHFGHDWPRTLPRGRVLGVTRLADCRRTEAWDVDAIEQLCGNWTPGRYAWKLEEPRKFDDPPAAKGRQGFFDWYDPDYLPDRPEPARLL